MTSRSLNRFGAQPTHVRRRQWRGALNRGLTALLAVLLFSAGSAMADDLDELLRGSEPTASSSSMGDAEAESAAETNQSTEQETSDHSIVDVIPLERRPPPIPTAQKGRQRVLEEIVVTATKREESLRDIPASISAYKGEDLEAQGVLSINEVLEKTPGVTSNSARPGDQRIVMRGISTTSNPSSTTAQPVGIFIGDTALNEPYAASVTPDLSAFDLAAVEVLKGPQGTLFGGAALSGVLRYRLNDPLPDEWQMRYFAQSIALERGSQAWTQGVVVNVPVRIPRIADKDNMGLRLAYIRRDYPGATDDLRPEQFAEDVNGGDGEQYRVGFLWRPWDAAQMKFTYLFQDYDAANDLFVGDSPNGPRATGSSLLPWPSRHEFQMMNLELQYEWDSVRLVSSSSRTEKARFNLIDTYAVLLGTPPPGTPDGAAIPFVNDQDSTSYQQEIRLQSIAGDSWDWLVGLYYLDSPIRYYLQLNANVLNDAGTTVEDAVSSVQSLLGTLGLDALNSFVSAVPGSSNLECELALLCAETDANASEKAFFFDVKWFPVHQLELSVGARVYETTVEGGFTGQGVAARAVTGGRSPASFLQAITEEGVNPKFSVTWRFDDDRSLYALVNKGFRFGGIQNIPEDELQNVPGTFKSDTIWNHELGFRSRWFGNTFEFDITAFYIEYTDPLVILKNALQINYYDNVGSAESQGIELSMNWLTPIPGIIFSLSGGTVDAKTTESFLAGNTPVPSGKPLPGSAEYQYSAALMFVGSPDWAVNVSGLVGYSYVGETYNDITSDDIVNDYGTVNAGLNLSLPNVPGRPTLAVSVANLTDETAPIGQINAATGLQSFYFHNLPRSVVLRFGLEF